MKMLERLPCYWPFVRGISQSPHKALITHVRIDFLFDISLNKMRKSSRVAGDLRHQYTHVTSLQ